MSELGVQAAPLDGRTVIDLSYGMAGPFAASRLADLGARVIKVEPPTGDPARGLGPPFVGADAAVFAALNRGKSSIVVDLDRGDGVATVRRLLDRADVVIEDLGPGRAEALGLGYDNVSSSNPGLVYVAVSAWGELGPMADQPGAELPVQAMAEYLSSLGRIGEPPVRLGADVAALNTAVFASQAALAGLVARERGRAGSRPTGGGQHVGHVAAPAGHHVDGSIQPRRVVGVPSGSLHESAGNRISHRRRAGVLRVATWHQ